MLSLLHLLSFLLCVLAAPPTPAARTSGIIVAPRDGTHIAPGASFKFQYDGRADYGISSFNYTVWLFTSLPEFGVSADTFATGYFFGRFSEPNYPANPHPHNPAPSHLVMPDFSKNPGGFGTGASAKNARFYLTVFEEYATGIGSVGFRIGMTMNRIVYNATSH